MVKHIEDTNYYWMLCGVGRWMGMWRKGRWAQAESLFIESMLIQQIQSRLFHMKLMSCALYTSWAGTCQLEETQSIKLGRKEDKPFLKKGFYFEITCFLCFFQTWNISNQSNLDWCTCSWSSEDFSPLKCLQLSHVIANCCRSRFLLTAWFGETSHNNVLSWAAVFQMSSEVIKMQIHSSKSPLILTATVSYWYSQTKNWYLNWSTGFGPFSCRKYWVWLDQV